MILLILTLVIVLVLLLECLSILNPVVQPQAVSTGFDSLTSRSLSLQPSRLCRGFLGRSILDSARDDEKNYGSTKAHPGNL